MLVGGKPLVLPPIPVHTWVRFGIVASLGKDNDGTFELTVQVGNAEPYRFSSLPCDPLWRQLKWWGWIADGATEGRLYIDDISLKPVQQ